MKIKTFFTNSTYWFVVQLLAVRLFEKHYSCTKLIVKFNKLPKMFESFTK